MTTEHAELWTFFDKSWLTDYVYCSVCCQGDEPGRFVNQPCRGEPTPGHYTLEGMIKNYGPATPYSSSGFPPPFVVTRLY